MPEAMPTWEYRVQTMGSFWGGVKDGELEALLNEWGEEGWEVFAVHDTPGAKVMIVAKRPLTLATRRRRSLPGTGER